MITGIRGTCRHIGDDHVLVELGGVTVSVMLSPAVADTLITSGAQGTEMFFYTYMYIEGGVGMSNLVPRVVGFLDPSDLEFFHLLTTVQGLSVKKSLKALAIPVSEMARAIELNDVATLKKLPEIGARTAEKIVMELKDKAGKFTSQLVDGHEDDELEIPEDSEFHREAMEILRQMQYSDAEAERFLAAALKRQPDITTAEELIQELFRNHIGPR